MSMTGCGAATKPPMPPPSVLPSVPVTICTRSPAPVSAGVPRPLLAEMPVRVAVVDHDEGAVALGEVADLRQLRHVAVHGEDAVGGDQLEAGAVAVGLLQPLLQLVHVGIGEAVALRLAEPDAVDDGGVVQRVGDDRVLCARAAARRGRHWRRSRRRRGSQSSLPSQRAMRSSSCAVQRLRPADEAHGGHAEAELVERVARRGDDLGVVGKAEIVVGAEVDELALAALRARGRRCGYAPIAARRSAARACKGPRPRSPRAFRMRWARKGCATKRALRMSRRDPKRRIRLR